MGAGFARYRLKEYKEAAVIFNQAIDRYAKRPELSLAWFGGGSALAALGQKEDSRLFFQEVVNRYPKSLEAGNARLILARKKKVPLDLAAAFPKWVKAAPSAD